MTRIMIVMGLCLWAALGVMLAEDPLNCYPCVSQQACTLWVQAECEKQGSYAVQGTQLQRLERCTGECADGSTVTKACGGSVCPPM